MDHHDPNDGVPDPEGRIVFGPLLRKDPTFGQLTSLYAIDPDGSDLTQLLDCEVAFPHFSPDGSRLAFGIHMDNGSMQVATMAADGTDLRILTSGGYSEFPDWSPDGSWLVYSQVKDADLAAINRECPVGDCLVTLGLKEPLWRMQADGSDPRQIGNPDTVDFWPRLSPDGHKVAFIRVDPPNKDWFTVMIRDLATGEEHPATANDREPVLPEWNRDGRSILYTTSHRPGSTDVWTQIETVPADDPTAAPVVLRSGDDPRGGSQASYAPDGSKIVMDCGGRLCTMDADGSNTRVILPDSSFVAVQPTWGRAPTK